MRTPPVGGGERWMERWVTGGPAAPRGPLAGARRRLAGVVALGVVAVLAVDVATALDRSTGTAPPAATGHPRVVSHPSTPSAARTTPPTRSTAPPSATAAPGGTPPSSAAATAAPPPAVVAPSPPPVLAPVPGRPALTAPTVVAVRPGHEVVHMAAGRDYVVELPTSPVTLTRGVVLIGGRNVVVDGGTIVVPDASADEAADEDDRRGLYLDGQTGTTWVHGVTLGGDLSEGIDIDDPAATSTVVLQDVDAGTVTGYSTSHHPDLLQAWAGPRRLFVDGFRGTTTYQGFFLTPRQHSAGPAPLLFQLDRVAIDDSAGDYALWRTAGSDWPLVVSAVSVVPPTDATARDRWLWPKPSTGDTSWAAVTAAG